MFYPKLVAVVAAVVYWTLIRDGVRLTLEPKQEYDFVVVGGGRFVFLVATRLRMRLGVALCMGCIRWSVPACVVAYVGACLRA